MPYHFGCGGVWLAVCVFGHISILTGRPNGIISISVFAFMITKLFDVAVPGVEADERRLR